jgi:hypothetical protein
LLPNATWLDPGCASRDSVALENGHGDAALLQRPRNGKTDDAGTDDGGFDPTHDGATLIEEVTSCKSCGSKRLSHNDVRRSGRNSRSLCGSL